MSKLGPSDPYGYYTPLGDRLLFFTHRELSIYLKNREIEELLKNRMGD